jgi:hypothetical protein
MVPYMMITFLACDSHDITDWCENTAPPQLNADVVIFMREFHELLVRELRTDRDQYQLVFANVKDFYRLLLDKVSERTDLIVDRFLMKNIVNLAPHFSEIMRRRILILSHIEPVLLNECLTLLATHSFPRILLFERLETPKNYLRPDEWKALSLSMPSKACDKGARPIRVFAERLYAPPLVPGGGWEPPTHDIVMLQFFTFLQPNWMELWEGLQWNMCTEMISRLLQLEEEFVQVEPAEILSTLFRPD